MTDAKLPPGAQTLPLPDALGRMAQFGAGYMGQCVRAQFGEAADQMTIVWGDDLTPHIGATAPRYEIFRVLVRAAWRYAPWRRT